MSGQSRNFLLDQWKSPRDASVSDRIVIANLGNTDGRNEEQENRLAYLKVALGRGFHVCADIIYVHGAFCLLRAKQIEPVPPSFLINSRVWVRAYDAVTLDALCGIGAHAFPKIDAGFTFTSAQFIWTLPGEPLAPRSVAVFPEATASDWLCGVEIAGICSNEALTYRNHAISGLWAVKQ